MARLARRSVRERLRRVRRASASVMGKRTRDLDAMTDAALRARIAALEAALEGCERERERAHRDGVRAAIRWLRELPRFEIVAARYRIAEPTVRRVIESAARRLDERLSKSEADTEPELPVSR